MLTTTTNNVVWKWHLKKVCIASMFFSWQCCCAQSKQWVLETLDNLTFNPNGKCKRFYKMLFRKEHQNSQQNNRSTNQMQWEQLKKDTFRMSTSRTDPWDELITLILLLVNAHRCMLSLLIFAPHSIRISCPASNNSWHIIAQDYQDTIILRDSWTPC